MQLHDLKRNNPNIKSRQIGRGGKRGKTSGRGGKGQTARAGAKLRPETRDIIKKIPKLRGRGKNIFTSIQIKPVPVNLSQIEKTFSDGDKINPEILAEKGLVKVYKGKIPEVKILSDGEITKKISVSGCLLSGSAKAKIEKVGGEVS